MIKNIQYIFLLTIWFWSTSAIANDTPPPNDPEKAALVELYNATSGGQWRYPNNTIIVWDIAALNDGNIALSDIPASQIDGVTVTNNHVTAIDFSGFTNVIGYLPVSVSSFTELKSLIIPCHLPNSTNSLTGVMPDMQALTKLETLNLSNNDCSGTVKWLGKSNALKTVNLSSYTGGAKLTICPTTDFSALDNNLVSLFLDNNELTSNPSVVDNKVSVSFTGVNKMTTLSLKNCNLSATSFTAWASGGMTSLKALYLDENPLITLPTELRSLTSVKYLYLNGVQLQTSQPVPADFFIPLDKLYHLELNNNNLGAQLPPNFSNLLAELAKSTSLYRLLLRSNSIGNLPTNFSTLQTLRTLDLSLNPIGNALDGLGNSKITKLVLEACSLKTSLPSHLYSPLLATLDTLDIGNQLFRPNYGGTYQNQLDLSQVGMELVLSHPTLNVKHLLMSGHCLSGALPEWFGTGHLDAGHSGKFLEGLDISNNQITAFPSTFSDPNAAVFSHLKNLNASDNPLGTNGTIVIKALEALEIINLSNQNISPGLQLHNVPDLSALTTLKTIDLSYNQLGPKLDDYFATLPHVEFITLTHNNFNELPAFGSRPQLQLYLGYNEFDFADLDKFLNRTGCGVQLRTLLYDHQKSRTLGTPITFRVPENMKVELTFSVFDNPTQMNDRYGYVWEHQNGSWERVQNYLRVGSDGLGRYYIDKANPSNAGLYRTYVLNECFPQLDYVFTGASVELILIPPLCESDVPKNGAFKLDKLTGNIIFERADCPTTIPISCVFGPAGQLKNVVSASAVTLSDQWKYTYLGYTANPVNAFETGERGKWRQKGSYTYSTKLDQSQDKNFNGGTFSYKAFNWKMAENSNNPGWLKVSEVEKYSPHGDPVQERNAINIASTAKFGYNNTVPYLVAQNADYASVLFEGFENPAGPEDGVLLPVALRDGTQRHSGATSLRLAGTQTLNIRNFVATEQVKSNGILIKIWTKGAVGTNLAIEGIDNGGTVLYNQLSAPQTTLSPLTLLASSGEWSLYQVFVKYDFGGNPAYTKNDGTFMLRLRWSSSATIWIDDLRIQPKDAEMSAYVYDSRTLKLLAVFDDQHFGLFYQYNAEGKLVRKIVETERGIRTVQETQYNLRKTTDKGSE